METRLCYEATEVHLSQADDGTAVLLIETAPGEANLGVTLSAEVVRSLALHISAALSLRPNPSDPV